MPSWYIYKRLFEEMLTMSLRKTKIKIRVVRSVVKSDNAQHVRWVLSYKKMDFVTETLM